MILRLLGQGGMTGKARFVGINEMKAVNLFEKCKSSVTGSDLSFEKETALLNDEENVLFHLTVPPFIKYEKITRMQRVVFYISDLHLVQHILRQFPDGCGDEEIRAFVHSIVLEMFDGEFGDAVRKFTSPVVLFGGDTSSCFAISELFYQDFVSTWEKIVDAQYSFYCSEIDPIRKELGEIPQYYYGWKEKYPWIQGDQKTIEKYSDKMIPQEVKERLMQMNSLEVQLRKKEEELGLSYHWENDYQDSKKHQFIYGDSQEVCW